MIVGIQKCNHHVQCDFRHVHGDHMAGIQDFEKQQILEFLGVSSYRVCGGSLPAIAFRNDKIVRVLPRQIFEGIFVSHVVANQIVNPVEKHHANFFVVIARMFQELDNVRDDAESILVSEGIVRRIRALLVALSGFPRGRRVNRLEDIVNIGIRNLSCLSQIGLDVEVAFWKFPILFADLEISRVVLADNLGIVSSQAILGDQTQQFKARVAVIIFFCQILPAGFFFFGQGAFLGLSNEGIPVGGLVRGILVGWIEPPVANGGSAQRHEYAIVFAQKFGF
mmetsp:Transcript_16761/g.34544  ORF Transcript_16761/g.34544 Transcript_16761/m.34544 type:complete len:280 (-) Transcript_16761:834-1673(-)